MLRSSAVAPPPGFCYCFARPRYSAVELRVEETGYTLALTLAEFEPTFEARINAREMSADEALTQVERGQHYLHATDPKIHSSVPANDPAAVRLRGVAALRRRVDEKGADPRARRSRPRVDPLPEGRPAVDPLRAP